MPDSERFPTRLSVAFQDHDGLVSVIADGRPLGDPLTEARRRGDGYRFHDGLHLALGVRLGWSPVLRAMLGRKRRSDPEIDRCEDGGRACMVDEAVCYVINVHRNDIDTREGMARLVALIKRMTDGFEVEASSAGDWAEAIDLGLGVLTFLSGHNGGIVDANFVTGRLRLRQG
jgi:MazG C-terminal domain